MLLSVLDCIFSELLDAYTCSLYLIGSSVNIDAFGPSVYSGWVITSLGELSCQETGLSFLFIHVFSLVSTDEQKVKKLKEIFNGHWKC